MYMRRGGLWWFNGGQSVVLERVFICCVRVCCDERLLLSHLKYIESNIALGAHCHV